MPQTTVLESGDLLFIPSGWWHFVRSRGTTLSVNYWWDTAITERARLERRLRRALAERRREGRREGG